MNKIAALLFCLWAITISTTGNTEEIDIFAVARNGNISAMKTYAQEGGDMNISNSKSYTPFILAAYHGHEDIRSSDIIFFGDESEFLSANGVSTNSVASFDESKFVVAYKDDANLKKATVMKYEFE